MKKEITIQEIFLRAFVSKLITLSKKSFPADLEKRIEPPTQNLPTNVNPTFRPRIPITEIDKRPVTLVKPHIPQLSAPPARPLQEKRQAPPMIPMVKPRPGLIDLGKLNFLVADPWVQTIECNGPEKKVTVRKNGRTLLTSVTLSQEEIKEIINKFSEETKIPLIEGMLKTAYANLLITAIVSDFIGGRFIIQKTNPRQFTVQR